MSTKTAIIRQIKGIIFAGKTDSNHWVVMDGPAEFGGSEGAPRPKELVLLALGGCTASDVASVLQKKRVNVDSIELHLTAEAADEHPQVYRKIHVEYVVTGTDLNPKDVERAIDLSQNKYCPVSAMLRPAVEITYSYKLQERGLNADLRSSAILAAM